MTHRAIGVGIDQAAQLAADDVELDLAVIGEEFEAEPRAASGVPVTRCPGGGVLEHPFLGRSALEVAAQLRDGGAMDTWRIGRLVILAGGFGMVVITALAAGADSSNQALRNRGTTGSLALSLLLLGLAAWHFRVWGLGKLVAIGLVAAGGVQFTLVDFGDGDMLWEQGFTGFELVASWVLIASAVVVLIGVPWSFVELTRSPERRTGDVAASAAWWQKWWMLVVAVAVGLFVLGQVFAENEYAPPIDTADEGAKDRGLDDQWSITPVGKIPGSYIFHMIKTFSPLEEADVDGLGGRFVWPEAEIDLCDIEVQGVGDGFVQIGILSPTTEGCPGMFPAFVEFGVPQTACLFVRTDGTDDEYCAPLTVDRVQKEWRIDLDEAAGIHTVYMIKTLSPLEEADVEGLGGRLVWPEVEIDLCEVDIRSVGDGFVEIGDIFGTADDCPGMFQAFEDFGLPQTACLFVRTDGTDDEYCEPLAVD